LLLSSGLFAQEAVAPSFEVASIRRSEAQFGSYLRYFPGGRFSGMSWIKQVVQEAYGLEDYQVTGGPEWFTADRYDIEAKAGDPNAGDKEMKRMLQSLLAGRFKLKFHRESKEFPTYGLVVDKNGPKFKTLKPGESQNCSRENTEICGIKTTAELARWLRYSVGRPVLDETGISGEHNMLVWFDTYSIRGQAPPPDYTRPDLFTALREQLGLRLDAQKAPFPILVIDDVQRPTEN
jgi:uncharacterized protein (TIGR03435 family)